MAVLVLIASHSNAALAHRDPCHSNHTCPSDHHTYPWNGLWCTSYADERLPSDTKTIVVGGRTYWCDGSGQAASGSSSAATSGSACGLWRWMVKTLQDRPTLLPVQKVTVGYLTSRPAPPSLPSTRLPFERHVFQVSASVILVRHEADSDIHLVLQSGANQMIAEAPLPACAPRATPLRRKQMGLARAAVRLCNRAVVTGVAFFDFQHGQTGVAPNAIELHPILAFRCLG